MGKELNEWWTTLVRDLDMVDLMDRMADGTASLTEIDSLGGGGSSSSSDGLSSSGRGDVPSEWSEVMERVVTSSLREGRYFLLISLLYCVCKFQF